MRARDRRPERVQAPRRGPQDDRGLDGGRPGLDQRREGERPPRARRGAASRRQDHARLDRARVRRGVTVQDPVAVALKFGFLAVLYLFLLWVARSSLRDLTQHDDSSVILEPDEPAALPR